MIGPLPQLPPRRRPNRTRRDLRNHPRPVGHIERLPPRVGHRRYPDRQFGLAANSLAAYMTGLHRSSLTAGCAGSPTPSTASRRCGSSSWASTHRHRRAHRRRRRAGRDRGGEPRAARAQPPQPAPRGRRPGAVPSVPVGCRTRTGRSRPGVCPTAASPARRAMLQNRGIVR
jgi:hypothetical protein